MAKRSLQKTNARLRFAGLPERLPRTEPGTVLPFDTDKFVLETMAALKANPDALEAGPLTLQEVQAWTMPVARCSCGVSGPLVGANRCIDRGVWIWRCPGCDCHLIEGTHFPKLFPAPSPTSSGP